MIKDYYEILNIPRGASQAQISQSYRKLALRYNPKTTIENPAVAQHLFSQLGEAYEVLSDHVKRAFFDKYGYEKLKQGFYQGGNLTAGYRYAGNAEQIFNSFFKNQEALGEILDFSITKEGSLFGHAFGGLQNDSSFTCENLIVNVGCKLDQLYQGATKTITYHRKVTIQRQRNQMVMEELQQQVNNKKLQISNQDIMQANYYISLNKAIKQFIEPFLIFTFRQSNFLIKNILEMAAISSIDMISDQQMQLIARQLSQQRQMEGI